MAECSRNFHNPDVFETYIFDAHVAQYAKNANGMIDRQCQYDRPFTRGHMMHIIDAHEVYTLHTST